MLVKDQARPTLPVSDPSNAWLQVERSLGKKLRLRLRQFKPSLASSKGAGGDVPGHNGPPLANHSQNNSIGQVPNLHDRDTQCTLLHRDYFSDGQLFR
jgi:hypothetical protein